MPPIVHVVPHTHWDREWYHPAARFQLRLARLVDQALGLLERRRLPSFLLDGQGIILDDYLALRPDAAPRLHRQLAAGRLECGPWYVLADNLTVSGEALVRNLIEGGQAVRRYGGNPMPVGYAPDAFGHPAILPTLFAGFGIETAVTWRGFGGERGQEKDLYRWRGPDGSEVLMIHLPPPGYEYGANLPADPVAAASRWDELRSLLKRRSRSPHWLVMNGADHHCPQGDVLTAARALSTANTGCRSPVAGCRFVVSPLSEYTAAVASWAEDHRAAVPRIHGELREGRRHTWSLQGTLSSRIHLKQANAGCQRLLERYAEPLAALADRRGGGGAEPLREELHAAWRTLLENHPHDSLCGTSADEVHREMMTRFARSSVMADEIVQRAADALISHEPDAAREAGRDDWRPRLVLFHPSPARRSCVVEAELTVFRADLPVGPGSGGAAPPPAPPQGELVLRDSSGAEVPHQVLEAATGTELIESPRYYPDCDVVTRVRVAIAARDLPPLGLTMLKVEGRRTTHDARRTASPSHVARRTSHDVRVSDYGLENEHLWLRVESDGTFAMANRAGGHSAHGLGAIECRADQGDSYTGSPRGPDLTRGAPDAVAVRVVHAGPLVGELEVVRRWDGPWLEVTSRLRLLAGARHVEAWLDFFNMRPSRRVRVAFPLGQRARRVVADGPFGPVERDVGPPRRRTGDREAPDPGAPMQRYVSLVGKRRGMTVLGDGLPQYEARLDGTVLVTLLRSFDQLSRRDLPERPGHAGWPAFTPDAMHIGLVRARLAVLLHDASALDRREPLEETAERFLAPPIGLMRRTMVAPARELAGPELRGPGLVFSALKPAESGKGIVLRCYNARAMAVRGEWRLPWPVRSAILCRLDEAPLTRLTVRGRVVRFPAPPRGIVTIALR